MTGTSLFRKTNRLESQRAAGTANRTPKFVTDGPQIATLVGEIARMPNVAVVSPIITDPASPYFGRKRFIAGISPLGGDNVML